MTTTRQLDDSISATAVTSAPVRRANRLSGVARRRLTVLAFMSPWILGFAAFIIYPMLASLYFSFTRYDLSGPPQWVGLANYQMAFSTDPRFWTSVANTAWIVLIAVPAKLLWALGIGLLLVRIRRGATIYRTIIYLPAVVPMVAAGLSFTYLLNAEGPLNRFLELLGLPQPLWFTDPTFAKPGLGMIMIWAAGNTVVILLASLLDVPKQLYEAATIDGARAWSRFVHVTLPMISPVLFFALLTGIIDGFQYFTQAYVMAHAVSPDSTTLGSPEGSTLFYGMWLYQQGYQYFNMGYAAALAWLLFIAIFIVTAILIRAQRRWVHYSGD